MLDRPHRQAEPSAAIFKTDPWKSFACQPNDQVTKFKKHRFALFGSGGLRAASPASDDQLCARQSHLLLDFFSAKADMTGRIETYRASHLTLLLRQLALTTPR
jgi:hypothetical protein